MAEKLILACDLSLTCPAFALVKVNLEDRTAHVMKVTHVKTNSRKSLGYRLFEIYNHVSELVARRDIDEVVIEKGFNKFAVATAQLQRVVGVVTLALYKAGYETYTEIAPTSVKKAITNDGKASKDTLAVALEEYVGYINYKTNDESDAVGVAIALAKQKGWL